ncbi:MAG TPA: glycosyltransferase family 4 protein [Opitutus sp.]|nr:glycosyltransferase family 4 protein [Opitutus sp.]
MRLLVLAHTPPPVHGQSLMVRTLVEGLPAVAPGIKLHHVNLRLSRDAADIGRWRPTKLLALFVACGRALWLRARHGPMTLYYVPAPAKRAALYRDFLVMLLCRPFFSRLVLHWHAVGLGEWLATQASAFERGLATRLLGRADLAIVLATDLAADAAFLQPKRVEIVPNGLDSDPAADAAPRARRRDDAPTEILFLGLCTREKGVFDTLTALAIANRREPGAFRLTVAGEFASVRDQHAFFSQVDALGREAVRHVGFVDDTRKHALLSSADVLCFPSFYPHEGQPLVLIEALAHDLPIVTTRWRALPGLLPREHVQLVDPARPDQIADALLAVRRSTRPAGELRAYYNAHYSCARHLALLANCLRSLEPARA